MELTEKTVSSKTVYEGKILTVKQDMVILPDGKQAQRDMVCGNGAVTVLPVDQAGNTWLVTQYRYAAGQKLLEAPAGKMEKGEDPALCAARELREETGFEAGKLLKLGQIFASPGYSNELLHLYLATELKQVGACPDEDEFLTLHKISLQELKDQILRGQIHDAKTVAIVLMACERMKGASV